MCGSSCDSDRIVVSDRLSYGRAPSLNDIGILDFGVNDWKLTCCRFLVLPIENLRKCKSFDSGNVEKKLVMHNECAAMNDRFGDADVEKKIW